MEIIMDYLEECTKFFAPLDEIEEAIINGEGIAGISHQELLAIVNTDTELKTALNLLQG